jgi:hypothetical protein
MPSLFDIGSVVSDVVDSIGDAADDLFTSEKERKKAERLMKKVEVGLEEQLLEVKQQLIKQRGSVLEKEVQGESWYQRAWRPFTMVIFVGVIVAHWFGVAGTHLDPEIQTWLYKVIQLGLGGYVFGRSAEKIAPYARDAMTGRQSNSSSR